MGGAGGPIFLVPLWIFTPKLDWRWAAIPAIGILILFLSAFAKADPTNFCIASSSYLTTQIVNGLVMGSIYGLMALGLTLIFSILGVVSFAHGEFYMIGGMAVYYLGTIWFPGLNPIISVFGAAILTFAIGIVFERLFLRAMNTGEVERPGEYAILVTFGLAFFLQYTVLALVGATPKKVERFIDYPDIIFPATAQSPALEINARSFNFFDSVTISSTRMTAAIISLILLAALMWFLYRTWTGKALRAVSQDRQAAAVTGINPNAMNTLAFGLGGMLAGLSGASLVQVFSWVPWVGILASARAFVIIVLGGMGSLPGAFIGGLIVGLVETLGAGCVPDPHRASAYIPAYGMVILIIVLLLKPTGLFGREL